MKQESIYIVPYHQESSEVIVTVGVFEYLKSKYRSVLLFRPIVLEEQEYVYDYESIFTALEAEEYISAGKTNQLHELILQKYLKLQEEYDFILVEGFDKYKLQLPFELNYQIAKNLNSGFIAVLNGLDKTKQHIENEIQIAALSINDFACNYIGTFITNTDYKFENNNLINSIPEISHLQIPTMHEIHTQTHAQKIFGNSENLNRYIKGVKIAAMRLEHFLLEIEDDDLIIVPSDRTDIILGCFLALKSKQLPHISGLVLAGDLQIEPIILELLSSLDEDNLVVLKIPHNTFEVTRLIQNVQANITSEHKSKVAQILGKFDRHTDLKVLDEKIKSDHSDIITPIMFEYSLFSQAAKIKQNIVLPEANDDRVLRAVDILLHRKVVNITLLGDTLDINHRAKVLGLDISKATIIDPAKSDLTRGLAQKFYALRKHKGMLEDCAFEILQKDYNYFATMLVYDGICDGMVSGAVTTTAATVRPALQLIKTKPNIDIVSSSFFMCLDSSVLVFADCAINQSPTPKELASIAISSANTAREFGLEPKVAMLSYSSGDSASSDDVDKVKEVVQIVSTLDPSLVVDGPMQYDAAVDQSIAKQKLPNSRVAGQANVLIFPDLNTGNNTYKAVQKSSGAIAIGPILQGLNGAVNDLSRGATVTDIVNTVAITAIQAQGFSK